MKTYIIKRLLLIPITLLGITFITFCMIRLAPGDPASMKATKGAGDSGGGMDSERGAEASIVKFRKKWKLDKPLVVQYVHFLGSYLTLDFGNEMLTDKPVAQEMVKRLMVTVPINLIVFLIIYMVALPIGIYSAVRQYSFIDRTVTLILFFLYSLPSFWVAAILRLYFCNTEYLDWFPVMGLHHDQYQTFGTAEYIWDLIKHLTLPIICLTYGGFAYLSRQMRVGMLEVIRQDYIRTARAKGLSEKVVVLKHALRNSLIPIVTLMGTLLPAMIGGAIIIETIFNIPGMGLYSFEGILNRDYNIVMATSTLAAVLTLLGLLLSDILYVVVDPRISFEGK